MYLTQVDQITVNTFTNHAETLIAQYKLFNTMGQEIFSAKEDSDRECERQCYFTQRGLQMGIFDNYENEVIRLVRPSCLCGVPTGKALLFSCLTCCMIPAICCACSKSCLQQMEVREENEMVSQKKQIKLFAVFPEI